MSCAVNPQAGREREYIIQRAPKAKKVFILGGGPAGMEAARVGVERLSSLFFEAKDQRGASFCMQSFLLIKVSGKRRLAT
jgi:NADPH-dependent 2,4-dienoyl-CoA reductase/sulfur reductase-like enzyme